MLAFNKTDSCDTNPMFLLKYLRLNFWLSTPSIRSQIENPKKPILRGFHQLKVTLSCFSK